MLNICPKEFDKTEAARSLFCLRGREDEGHVAGVLVSSPEGGSVPLLPLPRCNWRVMSTCVGQVLLMLQGSLEAFRLGMWQKVGWGLWRWDRHSGEESGGPQGAAGRWTELSSWVSKLAELPGAIFSQHPVRSLNVLIPPTPLVLTIPILFLLAIEMHFFISTQSWF